MRVRIPFTFLLHQKNMERRKVQHNYSAAGEIPLIAVCADFFHLAKSIANVVLDSGAGSSGILFNKRLHRGTMIASTVACLGKFWIEAVK
jgi:hypothetical protein